MAVIADVPLLGRLGPGEGCREAGKDAAVTRELKLALIVGFSLVLVVAVLISDHFSAVRRGNLAPISGDDPGSLQMVGRAPDKVDFHTPVVPIPPNDEVKRPKDIPVIDQGSSSNSGGPKTSSIDPDPKTPGGLVPTSKPDREYSIVEGDSMYKLAKTTYGDASLHTKLAEYNKLVDGKGLKIGQKLMLPAKEVLEGKAAPYIKNLAPNINNPAIPGTPRSESPIMRAMETTVVYKVQSGDTLSSIGRKVNASTKTVLELNPGLVGHEDELKIGQELKVPKGR
ncbi:MAG: LysM peptidoglycan-binding domain-containing protein [Planctomycetota bacterium]